MRPLPLALLLIAATLSSASTPVSAQKQVTGFGPWRLGTDRTEVTAVKTHGPYKDVQSTGGVETANGVFEEQPANISFVFGPEGLSLIQVWAYSGQDREVAFATFHRAYRYLVREFDAVSLHEAGLSSELTQDELVALLPVELKTEVKADGIERMMEQGQIRPSTVKVHLHPVSPLPGAEVYSSLIRVPEMGFFYVFVYFRAGRSGGEP